MGALGCDAAGAQQGRDRGLEVPTNLSLVSFDNTPVLRFTQPPLTAIDQPVAETAAVAVEMIIRSLRGDVVEQPLLLDASLIERQSTAPPSDI